MSGQDARIHGAAARPKTPPRRIAGRVSVLLPYPFSGPLDYLARDGMDLAPGEIVLVPLQRRAELGVVWDAAADAKSDVAPGKLKPVAARFDAPPLPAALRRFVDWVAGYTLATPGEVLAMTLRRDALRPPSPVPGWALAAPASITPATPAGQPVKAGPADPPATDCVAVDDADVRALPAEESAIGVVSKRPPEAEAPRSADGAGLAGAGRLPRTGASRRRVLAALADGPRSTAELLRRAGVRHGVIRDMAAAGLLRAIALPAPPVFALPDPGHPGAELSPDQQSAAGELRAAVSAGRFSVTLLDGVTGSGKTEVYLEAVAACIAAGRQALVLLPEIALSTQWLERFAARFGVTPAVWHSDLTPRVRRQTWRAVADGAAAVVVGARSALFLPFPDLGLIVVDEEHDAAFKQEEGVVYHARDMAVVRAQLAAAPAILVSATPSLETLANVEAGRYARLCLPSRHGGASLPQVSALDLRVTPPERGRFLSPRLIEAVRSTLARGEQAMLFLNRRGYAPLTLCRACGHRMQCPNCTAWLVEHRGRAALTCHHCGHSETLPPFCPQCAAEASLTPIGPGVERITEEAALCFPEARRLVMASDTVPGPRAAAAAAAAIAAREVDLVIGTQIVAKGWHFPHLTLVGVVDADLGLGGGDLRASERTVQLLHQVAGRAGRAAAPGQVILQTFAPEHPVMQALVQGDLTAFMAAEAAARRPGHWPPYGRLAALIVSGEAAQEVDEAARDLGLAAPRGSGIDVLGPAPAPLAILRGRHRRRLLLKTRRDIAVQPLLREWLGRVAVPRSVRVAVDVDPISFL